MKKFIIFDLDGVLISTDDFHYLAWKKIADQEHIYFDKRINDKLRGVSRLDSLNIILQGSKKVYSEDVKLALCEKKNTLYREFIECLSPQSIQEDVRFTLDFLSSHGFDLAIGSSSKNTPLIIDKTDLRKYFKVVVDGNQITHSKPNPEVFLKAANELGYKPEDGYVIEDSESGIDAANISGFISIGIKQAAKYKNRQRAITSISDLEKLVIYSDN